MTEQELATQLGPLWRPYGATGGLGVTLTTSDPGSFIDVFLGSKDTVVRVRRELPPIYVEGREMAFSEHSMIYNVTDAPSDLEIDRVRYALTFLHARARSVLPWIEAGL